MLLKLSQADSNIANAAGGSFSCPYCAFNHRTESEWVQHVGRHIGQSVQRFQLFKCKTCKWTSTSNKKIVIHNMVVHKQAEGVVLTETVEIGPAQVKTQQMPTKYKCKECDFTSNNAAAFKGHMTGGVHTVKDATSIIAVRHTVSETESLYGTENSMTAPAVVTPPRASSPASSGSRSSRKRYICETCGYKTEKEGNIRTHVDIHKRCQEAESFFRCGRCLYDAVYRFAITKHSKRQHPDKEVLTLLIKKDGSQVCLRESGESMEEGALPATIPESPAKRESLEETSVEEQTVENSHNTTQPNTAASPVLDEWVLPYIHHASANQLQCKLCGYMQSNGIAALKRHIFAVHLNYKPYKCKYCEYAAVEPNKTERHLQSSHPTFPPRIVRLRFKGILPEIPKEAPEITRAIVQDEVSDDEMPVIIPDEEQDIDKKPEFGDEWRVGDPFPSSLSKTPKLASMLAGPPAVPSASSLLQNSNPKETLAFPNLSVERDPLQNLLSTENSSVPSPVANSSATSTAHSKKQFHCVYCGYISKWGVKDVKTHIFSTHQKKYPFMCQHCNYGSRHQHLVRNHCFKSHPGKPQKIRNLILEYDSSFKMRTIDGVVHVATDEADLPVSAGSSADGSSSKAPSEHDGDDGLDEPVENKVQVDEDDEDDDSEYDVDDDDPAYRTHLPNSRMADYIWKCRECGYTKKAKVKVRYHILGRHLHLRPYKCGYCTFSHHTRWAVEDHVKTAHPNEKPNIQELMRESSEKIKSFLKKVKLKGRNPNELETMGGTGGIGGGPTAILTGDKDDTSKKMAKPTTAPTLTGMTGGGIYEDQHGMYCCDLCAYRSPTRNLVSKHRKTHFMYRPYGCGYCSFQAFCRTRIQTHNNKVHTGKPINIQMFDKPDKMVLSVLDKRLDRSLFTAEELSAASCYETTSGGGGHYDTGDKTAGDDGDDVIMGGDEDDFDEDDDDVSARSSTAMDDVAKDMPSIPQYSCNQCSFTSLKQQSMRHHVMGHLKYKPFKCPFCSLTYVKSFPIKKHIIAMHPTEDSGYIEHNKDPAMEENVKNMYSISAIKSNHATPAQDTSVPKEATKTGEHNTLEPVTRRLTGSVLYTCPMCGHMTDNTVSIRRHIMAELNYKPWQCPHCDYRDVQAGGIKRHCNIKHRLTSEFGVQKQDAEKEQMVQQLISQAKDGDKKKDVEMIDDDEDDESDMITLNGDDDSAPSAKQGGHLKVKLKGFSKRSPSDLSEEEPCKKKTRTEQESHLKMKMGTKPQKQPVVARPIEDFNMQDPESEGYMIPNDGLCVPKFLAQKNAHGGYSCRFCSYTTTKLGNFKEHLVRHTPHRFKCAYCQFTCQLTYDLRRHQRKMHPKGKDVIVKISDAEIEASQLASDRYPIAIKLARRDNESKSSAVTSTEATRKCGYCDFIGSSDTVTLHHKSKHKNRQLQLVDIETNKDDIHESDDHEEDSDESSSAQDSSGSETSESESDNDNDDDDDDDDGEDNNEDDESSESSDDDNDSSSDDDDNNGDNNDENDDDPEVSFKSSTLAASVAHIAADDDDDDADDDDDDDDSNEDEPIIPQHISDPGEEAAEHYMSRPPTADDGEPGRRRSSRKSCERLPSSSHSSDFRSVRPQATQQETEDAVTSLLQPSPQATARGGGGDRNNRRSAERYKRSTVLPPSAGIMVVDLQETEAAVSGLE